MSTPFLIAWVAFESFRHSIHDDVETQLDVIANTTREAVRQWDSSRRQLASWSTSDEQVHSAILDLLEADEESLVGHPAQQRLRERMAHFLRENRLEGYFVIRPDGISVGSSRDGSIGVSNPLLLQEDVFALLRSGSTVMSRPQPSAVALPRRGQMVEGAPTQFVAAPIFNDSGLFVGALGLRLNPDAELFPILEQGRLKSSGETYAVGPLGELLSQSRFSSGLFGQRVAEPDGEQLTLMGAEVLQGHDGGSMEPYLDYRGVPVVGAWRWYDGMSIGIATEIDAAEAFERLGSARVILPATAVGFDLILVISAVVLLYGRRMERRAHAESQALIECAPAAIAMMTLSGQLIKANAAFSSLVGLSLDELTGAGLEVVFQGPHAAEAARLHAEAIQSGGRVISEAQFELGGAVRTFQVERSCIHSPGVPPVVCLMATDITERIEAARQLEAFNEELELRVAQRTAEARTASQAKTEFLARMSHELRTPLNGVLGLLEMVISGEAGEREAELLRRAFRSASTLRKIIDEILDFSKVEANRMELEEVRFELDDVLEPLQNLVIVNPDVAFLLHVHPDVPEHLVGDPSRLRQVLTNLVGNAAKFTSHGHVRVEVSLHRADQGCARLHFRVEDTGPGIKPEAASRLFEPFTQEDGTINRRFGGTGLGLSICRSIVELMSGQIRAAPGAVVGSVFSFEAEFRVPAAVAPACEPWTALVISEPGLAREALVDHLAAVGAESISVDLAGCAAPQQEVQEVFIMGCSREEASQVMAELGDMSGARFWVVGQSSALLPSRADGLLLPPMSRRKLRSLHQSPEDAAGVGDVALRFLDARVLVVEDNETNQLVTRGMMSRYGVDIDIADSGEAALRMIQAGAYELVFMDVHMPGMDGMEATRQVRARLGDALPIVALSADVLQEQRAAMLAAGMDGCLAKPLERAQLERVLTRYLAHRIVPTPKAAAPMEAPVLVPPVRPAIDIPAVLGRIDGDEGLLRVLLAQFLESNRGFYAELTRALDADDRERAGFLLHTIRGTAGSLEMSALAAEASLLEDAVRSSNPLPPVDGLSGALCAVIEQAELCLAEIEERWSSQKSERLLQV